MCRAYVSFQLLGDANSLPKRESLVRVVNENGPLWVTAILGTPALVAAGIFVLHMLAREVLTFLMVWILASFPIGVLVGHCALSEE